MCSEYEARFTKDDLDTQLGFTIKNEKPDLIWKPRIKLTDKGPLIFKANSELTLGTFQFPISPPGNARLAGFRLKKNEQATLKTPIQKIFDLPSWREPLMDSPAVAVASSVLEPVYWGPQTGKVVIFKPKKQKLLFIASILITSKTPPASKPKNAFSMITDVPNEFMIKFHRRRLKYLPDATSVATYMNLESAEERYQYLTELEYFPELEVIEDRQMAKGCEKRIPERVEELEEEKLFMRASGYDIP